MKKKSLLKLAIGSIVLASGLFITNPTQNNVQAATSAKVMWGKTELKLGQIGKVTVLKDTPLVKTSSNGSLSVIRTLKKGEEFRVYQYKGQNGGLYGVGSSSFIQKNSGAVKYDTPSKAKLALVSKGTATVPDAKPPVAESKDFKTFEELKTIAVNLYSSSTYQPKDIVAYTKTDLESQFSDYSFSSADISQNIQGYTFYGRKVEMWTTKVSTGVYKNTFKIINDRTEEDEIIWSKKMDNAEKHIVANYTLNTDYDVVNAINSFVGIEIEYGGDFAEDHPYLEWRGNMTTCTGYSDMMAELLNRFGIESRLATGDAHAWNAVKVGGVWYWTDATFADTSTQRDKFTLFTNSERLQTLNGNPIETEFKATDKAFDPSTAKAYNYAAVKKAQAAKK